MKFLFRTGLASGVVVVALALASVAWIGYSARSSCSDVGDSVASAGLADGKDPATVVDEILPEYQLGEKHSTFVNAPPARVFESLKRVTSDEQPRSRVLNLLPVILGKREAPSAREKPVYEMLRDEPGLLLEAPNREVVAANIATVGEHTPSTPDTAGGFAAYRLGQGEMKLSTSFRVDAEEGGSRLTTETRIMFDDRNLCHDFAWYWGVIYPGGSLLRVDFLDAVERRAQHGKVLVQENRKHPEAATDRGTA